MQVEVKFLQNSETVMFLYRFSIIVSYLMSLPRMSGSKLGEASIYLVPTWSEGLSKNSPLFLSSCRLIFETRKIQCGVHSKVTSGSIKAFIDARISFCPPPNSSLTSDPQHETSFKNENKIATFIYSKLQQFLVHL